MAHEPGVWFGRRETATVTRVLEQNQPRCSVQIDPNLKTEGDSVD